MLTHVLVVYLFVQSGLFVDLVYAHAGKDRYTLSDCRTLAALETKTLPLQPGNDARWQFAECVRIESGE